MVAETVTGTLQKVGRRGLTAVGTGACVKHHPHMQLVLGVLRSLLNHIRAVLEMTSDAKPAIKACATSRLVMPAKTNSLVVTDSAALLRAVLRVCIRNP
jgi:hypothetical protein